MNPTALVIGMATVGIAVLGYCAWLWRGLRQPAPCTRTPDDVARDAAAYRAAVDLDLMRAIWPDPPSARVIEAQYRHDTAKQRKEGDR